METIDLGTDERVTPTGDGYRVRRADGDEYLVMPLPRSQDWAVYFGTSTIENPRPEHGLAGSRRATPQEAVAWALS